MLNYLAIPFGYVLDWVVVGQHLDRLELLGTLLIFGINVTLASLRTIGKID